MGEIDYEYMTLVYSAEALNLCSVDESFDDEVLDLKMIRETYVKIADKLISLRDKAGRSEAGRNYAIAITELENSCIRAIKGFYSK